MDKLKELIVSRKFWAALIGLVMIVTKAYKPDFPLAEDQLTNMVYLLAAYMVGVSLEEKKLIQ